MMEHPTRNFAFDILHVSESAAMARWMGRGDKLINAQRPQHAV